MPESLPHGATNRGLVRAIGRWSLTALVVNSVIGSGVFGLPSTVAGLLGKFSPIAVLLAGAGMVMIFACFAEVASQFQQAGGPYLYARAAFGRGMGIQMAWMLCLGQVAAPAANANLFVKYLGEFWPHAIDPLPRALILTVLVGVLAFINVCGVRVGAQVSNFFTAAKLVPLFAVIGMGLFVLHAHHAAIAPSASSAVTPHQWLSALLLLVFAYGGFETALAPMSEAKDPRRDAPFALFTALIICTVIYALIQWVVIGVLPDPAHSERPLADVARVAVGSFGAALVAVGALISFYGYLGAKILGMPRVTYALAEQGDFPKAFAAIHPRFHTPYVSILVFSSLVWAFALSGEFKWNVTLSAVARLLYYAVCCAALPVLRRKQPGVARFRLPAGNLLAALAVLICAVLLTQVDFGQSLIVGATITLGLLNWLAVRKNESPGTA
ncbi:MAG TPA: amino acid permease [Bryobacteraceae bacterium]|nr:amino acid permease [Bryobacteraceae bacterium]